MIRLGGNINHRADQDQYGDKESSSQPGIEGWILQDGVTSQAYRRVVVCLPPDELDEIGLAEKVWQLSQGNRADILILGLVPDNKFESELRWKTTTMTALLRDPSIQVSAKLVFTAGWDSILDKVEPESDLLVYVNSPTLASANLGRENLLAQITDTPVQVMELTNLIRVEETRPFRWFIPVFNWMVILGVVSGFFVIQDRLIRHYGGLSAMPLILVSVLCEAVLIFFWNGLWADR